MALTSAVLTAAPAQADEATYLAQTQPRFAYLSVEQLRTEGYRVCLAHRNGMTSWDTTTMVQHDLGVSVPTSMDIVTAAVVHLDC